MEMYKKQKKLNITALNFIIISFSVFILTGCAVRDVRHDDLSKRVINIEHEIDYLNNCRKPALTRIQNELIEKVDDEMRTDYSLSGLFNISLSRSEQQKTLLGLWLSREGSTEDFWKNLGENTSNNHPFLTTDELYEFKLVLFLGRLTQYRMPLLLQLNHLRRSEGLNTLHSISKLSRVQWRELIEKSDVDIDFETYMHSVDKAFEELIYGGCQ